MLDINFNFHRARRDGRGVGQPCQDKSMRIPCAYVCVCVAVIFPVDFTWDLPTHKHADCWLIWFVHKHFSPKKNAINKLKIKMQRIVVFLSVRFSLYRFAKTMRWFFIWSKKAMARWKKRIQTHRLHWRWRKNNK